MKSMRVCLPLLVEEGNVGADPGEQKYICCLLGLTERVRYFDGKKGTNMLKRGKPEVKVWMASWQGLHLVIQLFGVTFSI